MDPLLLDRLHQTNPWLFGQGSVRDAALARPPERWVDRRQVDLSGLLRPGRAHLIVGPRQAGKSSLAWSLLRRLDRPLYVDLEEPVFRQWCTSAVQFLADLRALGLPPDAVLLEEAQRLSDAALFVKGLVDNRAPFPVLVTGSSSFQLQDRTRESLAGRATRHLLLPLSLEEVTPRRPDEPRATLEVRRRRSLARHVRVGGYPEAWTDDHPAAVLSGLVQAVVLHDASDLSRVERPDAYQRLLELCAHRVGNLLVVSELASVCGVAAATAARYLTLMEDMHVLRLVPAFADGRRREVTSARKTFFVDTGLRNAVLGRVALDPRLAADLGALWENWVFTELRKALPWTWQVRYWRSLSGAEVDFVVAPPGHAPAAPSDLLAVEVKAGALKRRRLSRAARSFVAAYSPGELWVVNDTLEAAEDLDGTTVSWLPFHALPERLAAWLGRVAPDTEAPDPPPEG